MQTQPLLHFFLRDLDKTISEIEAFPTEESLWRVVGEVKNPAGNLGLHLAGNLLHFIGATLGDTGYVRNRDWEFSARDLPKKEVVASLDAARLVLVEILSKMSEQQLIELYPSSHFGENRTNLFALLTLLTHLNYHLGQINYLRRGLGLT
jgi:hypothetical protein